MNLTKEGREHIVRAAIKHSFDALKAEHARELTLFGDALYQYAFGADLPKLEGVPKYWLNHDDDVMITCDGFDSYSKDHKNYKGCPNRRVKLTGYKPIPNSLSNFGAPFNITKEHPFYLEAQKLSKAAVKLYDDEKELERNLRNFLAPFRTFAKLRAEWPEGEQFFPEETKPVHLPVDHKLALKINKMLGITEGNK